MVVVAGCGEGLAEGGDGSGLQLVEDSQLGDAWGDDVASAGVHCFAGGNGVAKESEFVGVLAAAELVDFGLDVMERGKAVWTEDIDVGGGAAAGFDTDACGLLGGEVLFE